MKKLRHIFIGWSKRWGLMNVSTAEKKLSDLRMKLCGYCEFSRDSKVLELLNGHAKYEHQLQCGKCKCPCLEKSLVVDEKCPVSKW